MITATKLFMFCFIWCSLWISAINSFHYNIKNLGNYQSKKYSLLSSVKKMSDNSVSYCFTIDQRSRYLVYLLFASIHPSCSWFEQMFYDKFLINLMLINLVIYEIKLFHYADRNFKLSIVPKNSGHIYSLNPFKKQYQRPIFTSTDSEPVVTKSRYGADIKSMMNMLLSLAGLSLIWQPLLENLELHPVINIGAFMFEDYVQVITQHMHDSNSYTLQP
jgi:hypothetical protein